MSFLTELEQVIINYENRFNKGKVLSEFRFSAGLPPNRPEHQEIDRVQASLLRAQLAQRRLDRAKP